jgi:hypothetical protein
MGIGGRGSGKPFSGHGVEREPYRRPLTKTCEKSVGRCAAVSAAARFFADFLEWQTLPSGRWGVEPEDEEWS